MKLVLILFATSLAACMHTPQEVAEVGEKFTVQSTKTPQAAADCMARNADDMHRPQINARIRPGTAGTIEVVGQDGAGGGTLLFASAEPKGTGSAITVSMSPNLIFWERSLGRDLVKDC